MTVISPIPAFSQFTFIEFDRPTPFSTVGQSSIFTYGAEKFSGLPLVIGTRG